MRALRPEEQGSAALEQCVFYRGGSFGKIQASRVEKASIEMLQPLASGIEHGTVKYGELCYLPLILPRPVL